VIKRERSLYFCNRRGQLRMTNWPTPFVIAFRCCPVAMIAVTTFAFGSPEPDSSTTEPNMVDVFTWECIVTRITDEARVSRPQEPNVHVTTFRSNCAEYI
jgi:hypothetical protein